MKLFKSSLPSIRYLMVLLFSIFAFSTMGYCEAPSGTVPVKADSDETGQQAQRSDAIGFHEGGLGTASPWFVPEWFSNTEGQEMTGEWWGVRENLEKKGISVASSYVFDVLGNPVGGKKKGARYDHSWGLDLNVDLEKLVGIKGLQFHTSALWRYGKNLSHDKIGNTFTASSIYGSQEVKFYGLTLEQTLFDNFLNIKLGRTTAGDDFANSPLYWLFVNNAIDGNPISLPINLPFSTYPNATWGGRIKMTVEDFYGQFGIYSGDSRVGRDSAHGGDFTMKLERGILYVTEAGYKPNQKTGSKGLPGNYKIGTYLFSGKATDLYEDVYGNSYVVTKESQKELWRNYGMYFHVDQMLYREKPGTDQGFTTFVASTFAPAERNQFPFFIDSGAIYKGLIPKRDSDVTAIGFAYGEWSNKLANSQRDDHNVNGNPLHPQKFEMMFDFTYKVQLTPWLFVQPDIQYIAHPGGRGDYEDAMVIGTRLGVTF